MGVASNEQFDDGVSVQNIDSELINRVKLFKNNFTPTITAVEADFTEANFSGYSDNTNFQNDFANTTLARHEKTTSTEVFEHNGGATSNTIYGWYLVGTETVDSTGNNIFSGEVVAFEKFATPIDMNVNEDRIEITLEALIEMKP